MWVLLRQVPASWLHAADGNDWQCCHELHYAKHVSTHLCTCNVICNIWQLPNQYHMQFEESGEISGMVSVEGEAVPFTAKINPAATGAVEKWLLATEGVMKRTLHSLAGDALKAYAGSERSAWILNWPGQLVLNCSQVFWTQVWACTAVAGPACNFRVGLCCARWSVCAHSEPDLCLFSVRKILHP